MRGAGHLQRKGLRNPYRYFSMQGSFPGCKNLGFEHLFPSRAGIENYGPLPPLPPHVYMASCISTGAARHPKATPRAERREKNFFNWYNGGWGVESNWVHSALRPPIGLLCQPRMIMMMEKLAEWLAGETEVLGENLPQCRFVHHKPHMPARTRTRAAAVGERLITPSLLTIFISLALYLFSIISLLIKETWIIFVIKGLNLSLPLIKCHIMKTHGGMEVQFQVVRFKLLSICPQRKSS
jgi:hypothetical protein